MTQSDNETAAKAAPVDQWLVLNMQAHTAEIMGDLVDAERAYTQAGELALSEGQHLNFAFNTICLGNVLLQGCRYSGALELFEQALAIRLELLAPCEWEVAEAHHVMAQTYQIMGRYAEASESWRNFLRCVDWLPDYVPLVRNAAQELLYCRGKVVGAPDPEDYCGLSFWRASA